MNQVKEPIYERFRHQKPTRFDVVHNLTTAKVWIKRLQHILGYVGLTNTKKVACATNQRDKEAMCWWKVVGQTDSLNAMTWGYFTKLFRDKYLGEAHLARKVWEFLSLQQGKLAVTEYVVKFDKRAQFRPTIVPTTKAEKMKFMHGL